MERGSLDPEKSPEFQRSQSDLGPAHRLNRDSLHKLQRFSSEGGVVRLPPEAFGFTNDGEFASGDDSVGTPRSLGSSSSRLSRILTPRSARKRQEPADSRLQSAAPVSSPRESLNELGDRIDKLVSAAPETDRLFIFRGEDDTIRDSVQAAQGPELTALVDGLLGYLRKQEHWPIGYQVTVGLNRATAEKRAEQFRKLIKGLDGAFFPIKTLDDTTQKVLRLWNRAVEARWPNSGQGQANSLFWLRIFSDCLFKAPTAPEQKAVGMIYKVFNSLSSGKTHAPAEPTEDERPLSDWTKDDECKLLAECEDVLRPHFERFHELYLD